MSGIKNKKMTLKRRLWDHSKRSWYIYLFLLSLYLIGAPTIKSKNNEVAKLSNVVKTLEHQKAITLALKENLIQEIESQKDPQWVEKILIKKLGVVPQGQLKVRFKKEGDSSLSYLEQLD
jgi:hypothetical protein